jgi:hypothetical protein
MQVVAASLKKRIVEVVQSFPFTRIHIIFEDSKRDRKIIRQQFGDLMLEEAGAQIEVNFYFMPKCANEPILEVADFIANEVGNHCRRSFAGEHASSPFFQEIFERQPQERVSFMLVEEARVNPNALLALV